jgi:hypothetical protein
MALLEGELIYLEDKNEWNTGRLGPVSQKLATQGYKLHQQTEGEGVYVWADYTGQVRTWADLKGGKHASA